MNWDALGAIGELVGAVAVVVTLLYVGRQIHQANTQTQASARYSFINAYGKMNASITENKDVASVFRRGMDGGHLDEDEALQFFALLGQFLNTWATMSDLHDNDLLPANQWTMVRMDIATMLNTPGGKKFWDEHGQFGVHKDFRNVVAKILSEDEAPYSMDFKTH